MGVGESIGGSTVHLGGAASKGGGTTVFTEQSLSSTVGFCTSLGMIGLIYIKSKDELSTTGCIAS
jgi:hypothetical protein